MAKVSILFLSDLHAFAPSAARKGEVPSYIEAGRSARSPSDDAFEALKKLVGEEGIVTDLVLCGGDLGDKADDVGVAHAWRELHEVGGLTRAARTLAVCGNHDLDSRYFTDKPDPDPKGVLQELKPLFPAGDESLCDRFWSRNYAVVDDVHSGVRVVLLNSSAFHGGKQGEIDHGRVASRTISRLKSELYAMGSREINIFTCHHHPFPHERLDGRADYESLQNGQALLNLLDDPSLGPWLFLHGHRHNARIAYASSSASSIPVIGAASFSARIDEAVNQVHLIEVESTTSAAYALRGQVRTWTFSLGTGFVFNSKANNGLPGRCGFGYRGNGSALAAQVASFIKGSATAYVRWADVQKQIEEVSYLVPAAFEHFVSALRADGVRLSFDGDGQPLDAIAR